MIKNDEEKVWMTPLLELRNELGDFSNDRERRDFRRMNGSVQLFNGRPIPGPYKKSWREHWLRRVMTDQKSARETDLDHAAGLELITLDELHEIRRIWLYEKHEFDDILPTIYEEVFGEAFPSPQSDDSQLRREDWELLQDICDGDPVFFELQVSLLDIERQYRGMSRRAGIYEALESQLRTAQYSDETLALAIRLEEERRRDEAKLPSTEESRLFAQRSLFDATDVIDAGAE
ncbi:adenine nucleotide alpha hydrolase family protein [Lacunimicrobium album]